MHKGDELYAGKAKSVYRTEDPDYFVLEFRDDTSAFDGQKVTQLSRKGRVNNLFNAFIMEKLEQAGIPTHFERVLAPNQSLVRNLDMMAVECVVRNTAAGSLCRRLGVQEGQDLTPPTYELFLKDDQLHDPMINESLAETFGWAGAEELEVMKERTYQVNRVLKQLFLDADMLLVDYKLEFGRADGRVVLGDEFTPDGCRIWDRETRRKMDKDRFRQDLGDVIETYEEVGRRLGINFESA